MQGLNRNGLNKKDWVDRFNCRRRGKDFGLSRGMGIGICRSKQSIGGINKFFPIIHYSHPPEKKRIKKNTQEITFKENIINDEIHQNKQPAIESLVSRLKVMRSLLNKRAKNPKSVAIALSEKCMGCSLCVAICPEHAISMNENNHSVISSDKCVACGFCADQCPQEAISLYKMIS